MADGLLDDEQHVFDALRSELLAARAELELPDAYYRGEQVIQDLGISIPPQLSGLRTVVGWPAVAVDRLEERLDIEEFRVANQQQGGSDGRLAEIAAANHLDLESGLAHTDALVYGRGYVVVGSGDDQDSPAVVTVESPTDVTVSFDPRTRRTTAALRLYDLDSTPDTAESDGPRGATLYLPDQTVHLVETSDGVRVVDRDQHNLGVVPVVRMSNRERVGDRRGSSHITGAMMSITDAACRRLMGIEIAAEYFGAPQRYILGASEENFQAPDGSPRSAWETYIGRILAMERDEDGNVPDVGQFAAHDPSNQTAIIDLYARIMSAHTGLPPHYYGYSTDNPASAEAMRAAEATLIKMAERRQRGFGAAWSRVMRLAVWIMSGEQPPADYRVVPVWRNAATPTVASSTDAAVKLVESGIIPPDSEILLDMIGLSAEQRRRVAVERRRTSGRALLRSLVPRQQTVATAASALATQAAEGGQR